MANEVSNSTLVGLLVVAILVSVGGAWLSLSKLNGLTGAAVGGQVTQNVDITVSSGLSITLAPISGTDTVNPSIASAPPRRMTYEYGAGTGCTVTAGGGSCATTLASAGGTVTTTAPGALIGVSSISSQPAYGDLQVSCKITDQVGGTQIASTNYGITYTELGGPQAFMAGTVINPEPAGLDYWFYQMKEFDTDPVVGIGNTITHSVSVY